MNVISMTIHPHVSAYYLTVLISPLWCNIMWINKQYLNLRNGSPVRLSPVMLPPILDAGWMTTLLLLQLVTNHILIRCLILNNMRLKSNASGLSKIVRYMIMDEPCISWLECPAGSNSSCYQFISSVCGEASYYLTQFTQCCGITPPAVHWSSYQSGTIWTQFNFFTQ